MKHTQYAFYTQPSCTTNLRDLFWRHSRTYVLPFLTKGWQHMHLCHLTTQSAYLTLWQYLHSTDYQTTRAHTHSAHCCFNTLHVNDQLSDGDSSILMSDQLTLCPTNYIQQYMILVTSYTQYAIISSDHSYGDHYSHSSVDDVCCWLILTSQPR